MLDGVFTRGTTPTHIYSLPDGLTVDEIQDVSIAYRQKNKTVLIKHLADCYYGDNCLPGLDPEINYAVVLSQEDTLLFNPQIEVVDVEFKVATVGSDVIPIDTYRLRLMDTFNEEVFDLGG